METFAIPHYRCYQSRTQFRTIVNLLKTGKEHRAACWQSPKRAWTLMFRKDPATTKAILDFYAARQGRYESFYWMDPKGKLRTVRFDHDDLQTLINYGGYGEFQITFAEVAPELLQVPKPVVAAFKRDSEARLADGTLVSAGMPRHEGAGTRIEPGTSNLIPLAKQKFEGWTAISGAAVTLTQNQAVAEWGAVDATRIQTSGGTGVGKYYVAVTREDGAYYSNSVWVKNTGDKTVRVTTNVSAKNDNILPGESRRVKLENVGGVDIGALQIQFQALNAADSLDFIAWLPGIEKGAYCTSPTTGTRSPETISVPVPFTPQEGGSLSFKVEVTDKCKRQVLGVSPTLLTITRADGGNGLEITHAQAAAEFRIATYNDAGEMTYKWFSDSLIPNGMRTLDVEQTPAAVILYCDGAEIARINSPKLPSGWGRAYLLSSAAGTYQADASVGDLQMRDGVGLLVAHWALSDTLEPELPLFETPAHSVYELHQQYNTLITPPEAGFEARLNQWQAGRSAWNLSFEKDPDTLEQLIRFYEYRRGQYESFNWYDPEGVMRRVRFGTDTLNLDLGWGGYGRAQVPLLEVI